MLSLSVVFIPVRMCVSCVYVENRKHVIQHIQHIFYIAGKQFEEVQNDGKRQPNFDTHGIFYFKIGTYSCTLYFSLTF